MEKMTGRFISEKLSKITKMVINNERESIFWLATAFVMTVIATVMIVRIMVTADTSLTSVGVIILLLMCLTFVVTGLAIVIIRHFATMRVMKETKPVATFVEKMEAKISQLGEIGDMSLTKSDIEMIQRTRMRSILAEWVAEKLLITGKHDWTFKEIENLLDGINDMPMFEKYFSNQRSESVLLAEEVNRYWYVLELQYKLSIYEEPIDFTKLRSQLFAVFQRADFLSGLLGPAMEMKEK